RHFSSSVGLETLDINQNETPKKKQGFRVLYSLFLMSAPEWPIILFGCLACLGKECNFSLQMSRVLYACGLMVLFSLIPCFTTLLHSVLFSISGCALIKRLRIKAFSSMLRQEVGWFDRSGNNSGALCARLSTDANIVQSVCIFYISTRVRCTNSAIVPIYFPLYFSILRKSSASSTKIPPLKNFDFL
ncbi:unnamed protein product, partial [Rotaria socialis]